jgi:hypothetical protein
MQRKLPPRLWLGTARLVLTAALFAGLCQTRTQAQQAPNEGQKLDALQLARVIDREIDRRLKENGLAVSPPAEDGELLRRLYLDLVGIVPTVEEATAFLDNPKPNKRQELIEQLLADKRFGQFQAETWTRLLLPHEPGRRLNPAPFIAWLAERLNQGTPLDRIAYDVLVSTGDQDKNPAVLYYGAHSTPDRATDNASRMFLGMQLQCAQCHNHPFTHWNKKDYLGMAQFFTKTRVAGIIGRQSISEVKPKPDPKKEIIPARLLGGKEVKLDEDQPYRPVLAEWVASPANPYFARAMANRFWYQLFGRGLVNPVDDMHDDNAPTHAELLAALAQQLAANGHDLRYLFRAICNSAAYQRTSRPTGNNAEDRLLYSHRLPRVLSAEQLYESLVAIGGQEAKSKTGEPLGKKAPPQGMGARDTFVGVFRVDESYDPLEYQNGIPQLLRLMNTGATNGRPAVDRAVKTVGDDPAKVVEQLYLATVSRRPTAGEAERVRAFIGKTRNRTTAYGDVIWALLNSSEFLLNH